MAYKSYEEDQPEEEQTGPLQQAAATARSIQEEASSEDASTAPMDNSKSETILKRLLSLQEQAAKAGASPKTQQSLREALTAAKEKYNTEATKNEWLEVAQLMGHALAQFGGAAAGGSRANMANLDFGPGIDYSKRTERALEERRQAEREAGLEATETEREYGLTEGAKQKEFQRQEEPLKTALGYWQRVEAAGAHRAGAVDQQKKMELAQLEREDRELQRQESNLGQATNLLNNYDNMSKKDKQQADITIPKLIGTSVPPDQLAAIKEQSKEGTGVGGFFKHEQPGEQARSLKRYLDDLSKRRADNHARQKQLIGGSREIVSTQTETSPAKDAKIEQYAKQYNMDYEQAKKVLVGRGYKPAE